MERKSCLDPGSSQFTQWGIIAEFNHNYKRHGFSLNSQMNNHKGICRGWDGNLTKGSQQ